MMIMMIGSSIGRENNTLRISKSVWLVNVWTLKIVKSVQVCSETGVNITEK